MFGKLRQEAARRFVAKLADCIEIRVSLFTSDVTDPSARMECHHVVSIFPRNYRQLIQRAVRAKLLIKLRQSHRGGSYSEDHEIELKP